MPRPRKYATLEEKRKARQERERERRENMTPEELEQHQLKDRERKRRTLSNETAEEKEERLRKRKEYKKRREKLLKNMKDHEDVIKLEKETEQDDSEAPLLQSQKLKMRRNSREKGMTPEKKEEYLQKQRQYRRKRRLKMSKEERKLKDRLSKYIRVKQKFSALSKEEQEEWIRKRKETQRKYYQKKSEARKRQLDKEKKADQEKTPLQKLLIRQYFWRQAKLASVTPEEKEEYYEKQRERGRNNRMRMTKEQKEIQQRRQYFRIHAKLAEMTREERKEYTRKNTEYARNWRRNMSGDKKKRYREYMQNWLKENNAGAYAPKSSQQYQRLLMYQRNKTANETSEERQKRLRRCKINQAVRKLKKDLGNEGVPQKEIEAKAVELKERMWAEGVPPLDEISTFTPRLRLRRGSKEVGLNERHCVNENSSRPLRSSINGDLRRDKTKVENITSVSLDLPMSTLAQVQSEDFLENVGNNYHNDFEDSHDYDEPEETLFPSTTPPVEASSEYETSMSTSTTMTSRISISINIKCPHCSSHFPQRADLTAHISSEHPKKCWKCPKCQSIMLTALELKEHFKAKHGPKPVEARPEDKKSDFIFSCIKCDTSAPDSEKVFKRLKDLSEHVKVKHPESYWPCGKCELLKYSERTLRTHEKVCGGGYLRVSNRKRHRKYITQLL